MENIGGGFFSTAFLFIDCCLTVSQGSSSECFCFCESFVELLPEKNHIVSLEAMSVQQTTTTTNETSLSEAAVEEVPEEQDNKVEMNVVKQEADSMPFVDDDVVSSESTLDYSNNNTNDNTSSSSSSGTDDDDDDNTINNNNDNNAATEDMDLVPVVSEKEQNNTSNVVDADGSNTDDTTLNDNDLLPWNDGDREWDTLDSEDYQQGYFDDLLEMEEIMDEDILDMGGTDGSQEVWDSPTTRDSSSTDSAAEDFSNQEVKDIESFISLELETEQEGLPADEFEEILSREENDEWMYGDFRFGFITLLACVTTIWWVRTRRSDRRDQRYMSPTEFDDGRSMTSMRSYV